MDQMRNELLQERTARQDLECDKMSLERQVLTPGTGPDPGAGPDPPGQVLTPGTGTDPRDRS